MFSNLNKLKWEDEGYDNWGTEGGVQVVNSVTFDVSGLKPLTEYDEVKIHAIYYFTAEDQVIAGSWDTENCQDANRTFKDAFRGLSVEGSYDEAVETLVEAWNDTYPDEPVTEDDFFLDENKYGLPQIMFRYDGSSYLIMEPTNRPLEDQDYDIPDKYELFVDGSSVYASADWKKVVENISYHVFDL